MNLEEEHVLANKQIYPNALCTIALATQGLVKIMYAKSSFEEINFIFQI